MKLTKEEKELLESVERGEWEQIPNYRQEAKRFQEAARATLQAHKPVSIRMPERDIMHFREKAAQKGMPYQTLISNVLSKYINGELAEISA